VQQEGICIGAQLCHHERHALRHQAADEMHVTPEAAELGDQHRGLEAAGMGECCGELGSALKSVAALARLTLHILGGDGRAFLGGERRDRARWASMPRPFAPCLAVETRRYETKSAGLKAIWKLRKRELTYRYDGR
jgi:hypothetical protein